MIAYSLKLLSVLSITLTLAACSLFTPYQPELGQGNVVKETQLRQLKLDMTFEQITFLLGTPMLTGEMPEQRWLYPIAHNTDSQTEHSHLSIEFTDGRVSKISRLGEPI